MPQRTHDLASVTPGTKKPFLPYLGTANFGIHLALMTPIVFTMALRVRHVVMELSPAGTSEEVIGTQSANSLGLILGIGAIFAMIANPLFGRLSDRTTSRFGMRRPWILAGAIGLFGALIVISTTSSIPVLLVTWCLAQVFGSASLAAINATVPDQVPAEKRGKASAVVGIASPIAMLCGAAWSRALPGNEDLARFAVPGAIGLLTALLFVVFLADRKLTVAPPRFSIKEFFGSFVFNPRKHPDFGWVWLSKFCLTYGFVGIQTYLTYFLIASLNVTETSAKSLVFQATLIMVITTVISAIVSGIVADRLGKRRPIVAAAGLIAVAGALLLAFFPSTAMVVVSFAIIGIGQGAFNTVDLALATLVLPSSSDNAKDLGLMTVSSSLAQALAPILAPTLIALGGGISGNGYTVFFVLGAAISAIGALLVLRVKKVQ